MSRRRSRQKAGTPGSRPSSTRPACSQVKGATVKWWVMASASRMWRCRPTSNRARHRPRACSRSASPPPRSPPPGCRPSAPGRSRGCRFAPAADRLPDVVDRGAQERPRRPEPGLGARQLDLRRRPGRHRLLVERRRPRLRQRLDLVERGARDPEAHRRQLIHEEPERRHPVERLRPVAARVEQPEHPTLRHEGIGGAEVLAAGAAEAADPPGVVHLQVGDRHADVNDLRRAGGHPRHAVLHHQAPRPGPGPRHRQREESRSPQRLRQIGREPPSAASISCRRARTSGASAAMPSAIPPSIGAILPGTRPAAVCCRFRLESEAPGSRLRALARRAGSPLRPRRRPRP